MRLITLFTITALLAWAQPQPNPGNTGGGSGVGGATTIGTGLAKSGTALITDPAMIPRVDTLNTYALPQTFTGSATGAPAFLTPSTFSSRTLGHLGIDPTAKRLAWPDGSSLFYGMANPGTTTGDVIVCVDTKTPCTEGVDPAGATGLFYGTNGAGTRNTWKIPQFSQIGGYTSPSQLSSGVNAQTGTTYTYADGDRATLVTHTNGSAIAGTLPQANGSTFTSTWFVDVQNRGAGTLTITPTTSTIDGAATLALTTGQGARLFSNGTNYFSQRGIGGGGMTVPGSGSELMYRFNATTLGAALGSAVDGSGNIDVNGHLSTNSYLSSARASAIALSLTGVAALIDFDSTNSTGKIGWNGAVQYTNDTQIGRPSAGVIRVDDNSTGGVLQTGLYTVSSGTGKAALPTCNAGLEGGTAGVVDLLTPTFLAIAVGGGAVHGHVYCNGTNWVTD